MKVYRRSDRVKIKIKDVTVELQPLSLAQKQEITNYLSLTLKNEDVIENSEKASILAIKYSLKSLKGATLPDGKKYELIFDENTGDLIDECINDLLNTEIKVELVTTAMSLLQGIPKEIVDPNTGKKLKDVEIKK